MKVIAILLASTIFGLLISGCETNPVTGKKEFLLVSPTEEKKMGLESSKEVEKELGKSLQDPELQNYINSVGQKIAKVSHLPDYGFSYKAIDDKSVNAFALPGGYIYITTGLLKLMNSESQLASVLGHETAHVTCRHIAKQMTNQALENILLTAASYKVPGASSVGGIVANLANMKFSREDEKQADEIGMDYAVKAGYNPYGMVETMEILEKSSGGKSIEFLSTHPNPKNRIGLLDEHIAEKHYTNTGITDKEDFAKNVTARLKK